MFKISVFLYCISKFYMFCICVCVCIIGLIHNGCFWCSGDVFRLLILSYFQALTKNIDAENMNDTNV